MHREIQKFVEDCLQAMEKRGWTYRELIKAADNSISNSTLHHVLEKGRRPTSFTVELIGKALELDPVVIEAAVKVSRAGKSGRQWKRQMPLVKKVEQPSIATVEERLRKAWTCFQQGGELLSGVNEDVEKVLRAINEQLRILEETNGLAKALRAFRK